MLKPIAFSARNIIYSQHDWCNKINLPVEYDSVKEDNYLFCGRHFAIACTSQLLTEDFVNNFCTLSAGKFKASHFSVPQALYETKLSIRRNPEPHLIEPY